MRPNGRRQIIGGDCRYNFMALSEPSPSWGQEHHSKELSRMIAIFTTASAQKPISPRLVARRAKLAQGRIC
jgi:hypothetical protein